MRAPWNHNIQYFPLIERIARRVPARNALDVGTGDGILAARLAKFVPAVVGLDSDATQIAYCAANYAQVAGLRFELGDVLRMTPATAPFDFIACSATIHHLDLTTGLTRLPELLSPGGTIVIVGLARESGAADWALSILSVPLNRVVRAMRGWYVHGAPTHDPVDSFSTVQRTASVLLPGCRFRRRLFWRYSIIWTSPQQTH